MRELKKQSLPSVKNLPIALALFGVVVVAGPLMFGAVDREVQIGVVAVLALGIALVPPAIPRTSRWFQIILVAIASVMVLKEFLPDLIFGNSVWRDTLTRNYGVHFSPLHHPEPLRALDALLIFVMAVLWFLWCRTLTSVPAGATGVAWLLFAAAAVVACVSLVLGTSDTNLIYGHRFTPGWRGFGPFPNRNHIANFLAMGVLVGSGCIVRAFVRRQILFGFAGIVGVAIIVIGILESKSRGGLLALAIGLGVFLAAWILRAPSRKNVGAAIAALLVLAALSMAFGGGLLRRFAPDGGGDVSVGTRLAIWKDTLGMWGDAPVFGHGIASFEPLFPIYQKVRLVAQYVIHPESSWLQWLTEMGLLITLASSVVLAVFCFAGIQRAIVHPRNFYLRMGGFSAVFALAIHSVWDVPGHRWGTAGFALAALALACPVSRNASLQRMPRTFAFAPLAVAAFWISPFLIGKPLANPAALRRLLLQDVNSQKISIDELKRAAHNFPLDFRTHFILGIRQLENPDERSEAWQRLRTSLRMRPGSWALAVVAANASQRYSPGMALHFWSMAVERAGHRDAEILARGTRATSTNPVANIFWGQFVESHPHLLLDYSLSLSEAQGRVYYDLWQAERIARKDLSDSEVKNFYAAVQRYGTTEDLKYWIAEHPERETVDFLTWGAFLYSCGEVQHAWSLLIRYVDEPQFIDEAPTTSRVVLERQWHEAPQDFVNTVAFAHVLHSEGKIEESAKIIRDASEFPNAPTWILRKAAFLDSEAGNIEKAVIKALQSFNKSSTLKKQ